MSPVSWCAVFLRQSKVCHILLFDDTALRHYVAGPHLVVSFEAEVWVVPPLAVVRMLP